MPEIPADLAPVPAVIVAFFGLWLTTWVLYSGVAWSYRLLRSLTFRSRL